MKDYIEKYIKNNGYILGTIEEQHIEHVYNLILYDMIVETNDDELLLWYGIIYKFKGNFNNMIIYYKMCIEKGSGEAMYCLGDYYYEQNDYDNMIIYYKMAIDNGYYCESAIDNLKIYYEKNNLYYELLKLGYDCIKNDDCINNAITNILNNETMFDMNYFYILNNITYYDTIINMFKYNILRITTIIPKKNIDTYLNEYITLINISKSFVPKNIINLIAGHLFI